MLKKLLTLVCVVMAIGVSKAQTFQIWPSDTIRVDTTITISDAHVEGLFTLKNNSNTDTLKMNWKVVTNSFPHTDTFSVCDPANCWSAGIFLTGTIKYTFLPQQSGIMKLDFAPLCHNTTGTLSVHTWASNDSANTSSYMTWIYNIATACTAATGITDINPAQVSLYPNPVKDEMKISLPSSMDNGQIDIYNLIGSKVYSQPVGRGKEIDLSSLESGLYVARISENGKIIATKKFTKAE